MEGVGRHKKVLMASCAWIRGEGGEKALLWKVGLNVLQHDIKMNAFPVGNCGISYLDRVDDLRALLPVQVRPQDDAEAGVGARGRVEGEAAAAAAAAAGGGAALAEGRQEGEQGQQQQAR